MLGADMTDRQVPGLANNVFTPLPAFSRRAVRDLTCGVACLGDTAALACLGRLRS